jgi:hypothetical protein
MALITRAGSAYGGERFFFAFAILTLWRNYEFFEDV